MEDLFYTDLTENSDDSISRYQVKTDTHRLGSSNNM